MGDTTFKQLDNQSTFDIVTGFSEFGTVGDQKTFGVDALRPLSAVFDSVMIDTAGLANTGDAIFGTRATSDGADGSTQLIRSFKIGDEVKILTHADLTSFDITDIDSVNVYLVDLVTTGYQVPDSAFYSVSFAAPDFLGSGGVMRYSFIVEAGQFESEDVIDNVRVGTLGYLLDKAGNLSAATSTATSEAAFRLDIYTVADTRTPELSPVQPVKTGDRFTGLIDTTLALLESDGSISSSTVGLLPMSLVTDEGTSSILAIVGADTVFYDGGNATDTIEFASTDSFTAPQGAVAGATINLILSAFDSVGNAGSLTLEEVILDQEMPVPQDIFPASASLDTAVITELTRHSQFTADESLNSVQVIFVEVTSRTPAVATELLKEIGAGIVSVTVTDSLIDDAVYAFQVLTTDIAGNTFATAVDTFTFDADFANPSGDSFVVTLDSTATTVDSVIAGVNLPITITAIDTALSNAEDKLRSAVTFGNMIVAGFDPLLPSIVRLRAKPAATAMTIFEPARSVDDIPPAPVTSLSGAISDGATELSWTLSEDDRLVGFVPYRGFAIPIPGVERYRILGGGSDELLDVLTEVPAGTASISVNSNIRLLRVDALDDDNATPGERIKNVETPLVDVDGNPVIIIVPDGDTPLTTDFEDFLAFAGSFNKESGEEGYEDRADINDDGLVDFADFLAFAGAFGRTAAGGRQATKIRGFSTVVPSSGP